MNIHLLDDDVMILDAARFLLEQAGYKVKTWSNSQQFLQEVNIFEPGILLLDMKMPHLDGKAVHQFLQQQNSPFAVIIMTGHGDIEMAVQQLKLGAVDFLQKPMQFNQLQSAIKIASKKTADNYELYKIQKCYEQLSSKELEVLYLLLKGYINREIAEALNISIRTVEVHRSHIMEKMQAQTVVELIYKTMRIKKGE
ncbi:DNA-binding response regulator [Canicola haemoglobinophilus]|uniref:Two component response regulator n=1 Tax=Canicola haemoglobinophilus TaxID=733 RepID=A0A1V4AZ22_9PAST|nr:response regulator [Canicola haemoglobinophilus]OOR98055.1 DNA-binding response regulator [Canicola haemoglobinophilus]STO53966.1 two component response regulator [Canicola haemoglobinophilus]STO60597.1 two component response regulator [Canicola haemoglobinophilus]STO68499.1 two component response regulator [Canicola haemoglobinophilus]